MATNRADSELPDLDEIPSIRVHDILEYDVHLAPIRQNDATALWNTFHPGSESIGNYIDVGFYDQTSAGRAIEQWNNSMRDGTTVALGIYISGRVVGHLRSSRYRRMLGESRTGIHLEYWLAPPYQRQGIMIRSIPYFLDFAVNIFFRDVEYIEIVCHPLNDASIRVARRIGSSIVQRTSKIPEALPRVRFRISMNDSDWLERIRCSGGSNISAP
jgi:RimJ/RimL family protein N-acetyltransferase